MARPDVPSSEDAGEMPAHRHLIDLLFMLPTALFLIYLAIDTGDANGPAQAERLLILWASLCLVFQSGARPGRPHADGLPVRDVAAAAPALAVAMLANLLAPSAIAIAILAVAHAAQGAWDVLSSGDKASGAARARRRTRQTMVMVAMLIAAIFFAA